MSVCGWQLSRGLGIFLLLLPASGLLGCGSRSAQTDGRAADVAALRELHDQLTRAENSGDASVFERTSASDVLVLPPDGSLLAGRQAHVNYARGSFNEFTGVFDNKSDEIVVSGDWGFDRGTYRYTQTPRAGGTTVTTAGNYLWLARREADGVWRYARIIWNTTKAPPLPEQ